MGCEEMEAFILDFPELDDAARGRVRAHAAKCTKCRELLDASVELDARLSMTAKAPERLGRAVLARIERRPSYLPELFDFVGWAAVITVAVGLLREFLATYPD
jgi:hypothetical protein